MTKVIGSVIEVIFPEELYAYAVVFPLASFTVFSRPSLSQVLVVVPPESVLVNIFPSLSYVNVVTLLYYETY